MYGGSAIASGGFGCVFNPSIKCKNKKTKKNHVSKLMLTKLAEDEIKDSKKLLTDLKKIPNYLDYFIVPENICNPNSLTLEDKVNFDSECTSLGKQNINSKNINKSLSKLKIIQLPEGGKDLSNYFAENVLSLERMITINKLLVNLLNNGIVKMNNKHIYHFDVKSSNILIKENSLRLIDWGLSNKLTPEFVSDKFIPKRMKFRPFHYNMPFSIIVLNDESNIYINSFIKTRPTLDTTIDFLYNLYENKISQTIIGKHHDELIKFILSNHLYPNKNPDLVIFTYIAEIVKHFTENGRFMVEKYFYDVYLKNCDIWGFATVYLLFAIDNVNNLSMTQKDKTLLKKKIFDIYKKYIIEFSYKPIPIKKFSEELLKLNSIIKNSNKELSMHFNLTTGNFDKDTYNPRELNEKYLEIKNIKKKITRPKKTTTRKKTISNKTFKLSSNQKSDIKISKKITKKRRKVKK
tara:strand:- start:4676 stop:6064 length:1389 start_codon:yes stop_codon:yes gene_type:complete